MARASTHTLISLDRAADVMQLDPLHFNSVVSENHPNNYACDDTWFQNDYQNTGKVSRETFARALRTAEDKVAQHLGYFLLPNWVRGEEHQRAFGFTPENPIPVTRNLRGFAPNVITNWGFVIAPGVRGATLIEAGVAVVFSDDDGDGYQETATVTVVTTVTDPEEISLFYPDKNAVVEWEIRPTLVTIAAGTATVVFKKCMIVLEALWDQMSDTVSDLTVNGDDNSNFLPEVDVYRIFNDTSTNLTFYSRGDTPATLQTASGALTVLDSRRGILEYVAATWDAVSSTYTHAGQGCSNPFKMELFYRAGLMNKNALYPTRQMDPRWERELIYYAISLIDAEICGCSNFVQHAEYMKTDLAEIEQGHSFTLGFDDLRNPFGTTRIGLEIWRHVNEPSVRLYR